MKNIILFDDGVRDHLLPLTFTRPAGELRLGILTIREKWERWMEARASYITQDYLAGKFPIHISSENYVINGSLLPSGPICQLINELGNNEALLFEGELIAARLDKKQFQHLISDEEIEELAGFELEELLSIKINHLWDLFHKNDQALRDDFELITRGRKSQPLPSTNQILGDRENIFIEEGASIECSILNAEQGPIYLGRNTVVMEGCTIRGGFALCEGSTLKMGTRIYGSTTIGPYSKMGGEIKNSVVIGYSSKGHEGFLGNSVLGEWCNIGAGTNTSNLKNNYTTIRLWDYLEEKFGSTGLQFCGLIMGDHSKCGINTMFNTGTVVGVFANIFGAGYPRNFIPSFSWGGAHGFKTYKAEKAFEVAPLVMSRRNREFSEVEKEILEEIFELTRKYRPGDN